MKALTINRIMISFLGTHFCYFPEGYVPSDLKSQTLTPKILPQAISVDSAALCLSSLTKGFVHVH